MVAAVREGCTEVGIVLFNTPSLLIVSKAIFSIMQHCDVSCTHIRRIRFIPDILLPASVVDTTPRSLERAQSHGCDATKGAGR